MTKRQCCTSQSCIYIYTMSLLEVQSKKHICHQMSVSLKTLIAINIPSRTSNTLMFQRALAHQLSHLSILPTPEVECGSPRIPKPLSGDRPCQGLWLRAAVGIYMCLLVDQDLHMLIQTILATAHAPNGTSCRELKTFLQLLSVSHVVLIITDPFPGWRPRAASVP